MKKYANDVRSKIRKFATKRNIILASLSTVSTVAPVFSCAWAAGLTNGNYVFDGKTYSSFDDIVREVKNNSTKNVVNKESDAQWSITIGGSTKTFNDPYLLRKEIEDQYIKTVDVKTDIVLNDFADQNGILNSGDKRIWNRVFSANTTESNIYLGKDGLSYTSADEAFMSYFIVESGYKFNGIYFTSKSDLRNYLLSVYLPQKLYNKNKNNIVLKAPSGQTSSPIDLNSEGAYDLIKSFIENNSERSFHYTNQVTNSRFSINRYNIDDVVDKVNLSDMEGYLHIQSNAGSTRYVVDNSWEDDNNLIGPYLYNGVLDVGSLMNKEMWAKVIGINKQVYTESKVDSMLATFFSSIINDDAVLNKSQAESTGTDPLLFRTLLEMSDKSSYDEWFLQELGRLSPELKNAVVQANVDLMDGKKYNVFYKIPILYNFLMNRVVSWGLGLEVQNLIVNYFSNVCNFIQDAIEMIALYNPVLLQSKDGKSTFNMKKFFQIGNPEYDLNTNVEYFANELKTNYPNLLALMTTYISAMNNITLGAGLIPFSAVDYHFLIEFGIFDKNSDTLQNLMPALSPVYEVFSQLNYDGMMNLYIQNAKRADIEAIKALPADQQKAEFDKLKTNWTNNYLSFMLSGVGAKNNQYYQMANSLIKTEIQTFLATGHMVVGGYLAKLYSPNPNHNKLLMFLKYVTENEVEDVYQVYLLFMLDKRLSLGVINNETISSPIAFAHAVSRIIFLSFGTGILVGSSVKSLYGDRTGRAVAGKDDNTAIPNPSDNPILTLYEESERIIISGDEASLSRNISESVSRMAVENNLDIMFDAKIGEVNKNSKGASMSTGNGGNNGSSTTNPATGNNGSGNGGSHANKPLPNIPGTNSPYPAIPPKPGQTTNNGNAGNTSNPPSTDGSHANKPLPNIPGTNSPYPAVPPKPDQTTNTGNTGNTNKPPQISTNPDGTTGSGSGSTITKPLPPIPGEGTNTGGGSTITKPLPPIPGETTNTGNTGNTNKPPQISTNPDGSTGSGSTITKPLPSIPGQGSNTSGSTITKPLPPLPGESTNTGNAGNTNKPPQISTTPGGNTNRPLPPPPVPPRPDKPNQGQTSNLGNTGNTNKPPQISTNPDGSTGSGSTITKPLPPLPGEGSNASGGSGSSTNTGNTGNTNKPPVINPDQGGSNSGGSGSNKPTNPNKPPIPPKPNIPPKPGQGTSKPSFNVDTSIKPSKPGVAGSVTVLPNRPKPNNPSQMWPGNTGGSLVDDFLNNGASKPSTSGPGSSQGTIVTPPNNDNNWGAGQGSTGSDSNNNGSTNGGNNNGGSTSKPLPPLPGEGSGSSGSGSTGSGNNNGGSTSKPLPPIPGEGSGSSGSGSSNGGNNGGGSTNKPSKPSVDIPEDVIYAELKFDPSKHPDKSFSPKIHSKYEKVEYATLKGMNPDVQSKPSSNTFADRLWSAVYKDIDNPSMTPEQINNKFQEILNKRISTLECMGQLDDAQFLKDFRASVISNPLDSAQAESARRFDYMEDMAMGSSIFSEELPRPSDGSGSGSSSSLAGRPLPPIPTDADGSGSSTPIPGGSDDTSARPTVPNPGGDGDTGSEIVPDPDTTPDTDGSSRPRPNTPFEDTKKSWWSGASSKFSKMKNAVATIAEFALEIFATAATAMELFFFFYELFSVKYTQEFYVYTAADGTEFIWDGGLSATKYLGLVNENIQNIDAMKLITPIEITTPQLEECYYYNGVKFYDIREMKRSILMNMVNGIGTYISSKFDLLYSFNKNNNENYSSASTLEELTNEVLLDLGLVVNQDNTIDYSNLNENSIYLSSANHSLSNGVIVTPGDNYGTIANNIVDNLRKVYFVVLPDIDGSGFATGTVSNSFVYPGNYWDGTKVVNQNPNDFPYILENDSANDLKGTSRPDFITKEDFVTSDPILAEKMSREELLAQFKTRFNVRSKSVLPSGKVNSDFASIGNAIATKIYIVKLPDSRVLYFVDAQSAKDYLYGYFGFNKITNTQTTVEYYYNGLSFGNDRELLDWIRENTKTAN